MDEIFTVIDFPLINKLAFLILILSMLLDTGLSLLKAAAGASSG